MSQKTAILFLCTGNSCRSQMAEGFAKALRPDDLEAWSAGVKPKGVDPKAVKVMAEAGFDISAQSSSHVREHMGRDLDYVITLCGNARETCPVFPGKARVIHRGFDDPPSLAVGAANEDEALDHYRRVRDEIREFVLGLPANIEDEAGVKFKLDL